MALAVALLVCGKERLLSSTAVHCFENVGNDLLGLIIDHYYQGRRQ
jgi:hypothetical protein